MYCAYTNCNAVIKMKDKSQGCDMRGMLSFQILWLLAKKNMNGEEMAQEIEKRRGDKPKAGTIYPALKELRITGLIKGRKEGKSVIYTITPLGKIAVKRAVTYFMRSFGEIFEEGKTAENGLFS